MEPKDAISLKKNLEEVLKIVDEYGKQSKQFSSAENSLNKTIDSMNAANKNIARLFVECNEYLERAKKVIEFQDKIPVDENKINNVFSTVSELEAKTDALTESINLFIEECKETLSEIKSNQQENSAQINEKLHLLEQKIETLTESNQSKKTSDEIEKRIIEKIEKSLTKKTKEIVSAVSNNQSGISQAELLKLEAQNQGLNLRVVALEKKIK